jgi:hypothetical protein
MVRKGGGASRCRPVRPDPLLRACGVGTGPYAPDRTASRRAGRRPCPL